MSRGGICIVPLTTGVSGTERIARDLLAALAGRNVRISAAVPEGPALDAYAASLLELTRDVVRIPPVSGWKNRPRSAVSAALTFRRLAPACIHFHCPSYRWGAEVVLAARLARVPKLVRTEHNPLMDAPRTPLRELLRAGDDGCSAFSYVSTGNAERFERFLPNRVGRGRVILNGVDAERFQPPADDRRHAERISVRREFGFPDDAKLAIFVGAFGERRPLAPIFTALERLLADPVRAPSATAWRVLVVGVGDFGAETAGQSWVLPYLKFAGRREDTPRLLAASDLFVSASHFEGLSIAMLEAWASGVPVLSYDVDGMSDVIPRELASRFRVPHGNVEAYADAWFDFMQEGSPRRDAQREATARVRSNFGLGQMLGGYLDLYRQLGAL